MRNFNYHLIIFLLSFFLLYKESFSDVIEQKIKDFILKNPEVILESLKNFEEKQETKLLLQNSQKIKDYKDQIFKSKTDLYNGILNTFNYIKKRGVKPFNYYMNVEIKNELTPETWLKEEI